MTELTNLSDARHSWLANAHDDPDRVVLAFGWPPDLGDDAILDRDQQGGPGQRRGRERQPGGGRVPRGVGD